MLSEQSTKVDTVQRAVDGIHSKQDAYKGCVVTIVEQEGGHVRLIVRKPTSREGKPVLVMVQPLLNTPTQGV